jgi:type VI secretion system secreted protein Hcp
MIMGTYCKFDGVEGDVTTKGFEKQIEILSFSFGANRNIKTAARKDTNRESDEPRLSEVSMVKLWDAKSSPMLFQESVGGKLNHKVTITFTTTSEGAVEKYLEIELTDTAISSFQMSDGGGDRPTESIGLNFSKIQYRPFTVGPDKVAKAGATVMYDLTKMSANP